MKTFISILIILALATAVALGAYLYSLTADAQSLATHGHAGDEQFSGSGPFGDDPRIAGHGRSGSPIGALPELFGHLAIMVIVIAATLCAQKLVRRFSKPRPA